MNVSATRARLEVLTKELLRDWAETKAYWRDVKAQEFERQYLQELNGQVEKTGTILEKLGELLTKVRNDCE
jgi:hypothetical protein